MVFTEQLLDCIKIDIYLKNLKLIPNEKYPFKQIKFLDIKLAISDGSIKSDLYDKREEYEFVTDKIQNYDSCISRNIFCNIIINNITRIQRLCSSENKENDI